MLPPGANSIRLFWCKLHRYWHNALSFDLGYAAVSINYAKKFIKLTPVACAINIVMIVNYAAIGIIYNCGNMPILLKTTSVIYASRV